MGKTAYIMVLWAGLLCPVAFGQIWPSQDHPMQGAFDRGNQALWAAQERLDVSVGQGAWTNYMTAALTNDYFKQRTKLAAAKSMFHAAAQAGKFVYPDDDATPDTFETVTPSNLIVRLGMPATWWTNTPYFNLAAESNGYRFVPGVASNLVWMTYAVPGAQLRVTNVFDLSGHTDGYRASWEDAFDVAVEDYAIYANQEALHFGSLEAWLYPVSFYTNTPLFWACINGESAEVAWQSTATDAAVTNRAAACSLWAKAQPKSRFGDIRPLQWDDYAGVNVHSNWTAITSWTRNAGDTNGPFVLVGGTNPPPYSATIAAMTNNVYVGWGIDDNGQASGWRMLHKFNAPGLVHGFEWFK